MSRPMLQNHDSSPLKRACRIDHTRMATPTTETSAANVAMRWSGANGLFAHELSARQGGPDTRLKAPAIEPIVNLYHLG